MLFIDGNVISALLPVLVLFLVWFFIVREKKKPKLRRGFVDEDKLNDALRDRTTVHSGYHITDFRLESRHPDTTASEYFHYMMEGLKWCKITDLDSLKDYSISFRVQTLDGEFTRIWLFDHGADKTFLKELQAVFKEYVESDSKPEPMPEPIESIVRRARGGETSEIQRYGYAWGRL